MSLIETQYLISILKAAFNMGLFDGHIKGSLEYGNDSPEILVLSSNTPLPVLKPHLHPDTTTFHRYAGVL